MRTAFVSNRVSNDGIFSDAWRIWSGGCMFKYIDVGRTNGVKGKIPMKLTDEEVALLHKSADALKEVIAQIEL